MTQQQLIETLQKGERLTLEAKLAKAELPRSVWETYSAFANTIGGTIFLGIDENRKEKNPAKRFAIVGVKGAQKILTDFWNTINSNKVSENILTDADTEIVEVDGKQVIVIHVPQADWRVKPIYLNDNVYRGTFRRNHEGGLSKARNPRMQNMLRMIGFGENLGSGFPLILSAWQQVGWKAPLLENKIEVDEVALTLYIYGKDTKANNPSESGLTDSETSQTSQTTSQTSQETVQETSQISNSGLTGGLTSSLTYGLTTKEKVYKLIVENPFITRAELVEATGKALNTIQKCLNKLKSENRIRRVGSATFGGQWEIIE
jgi:predicted HTH transcriptional regulator